ncbi:HNH endonuclease [Xanthomonas phage Murka]|nr:HNH endonuclease [Xanthomonas phage Murka]
MIGTMQTIITRAEAKAQGRKTYFTGKPCKHGHVVVRRVNGGCVDCMRASSDKWKAADPEGQRSYASAYLAANPNRKRDSTAAWRAANPQRNRDRGIAWRAANQQKVAAYASNRRAAKLSAMPADFGEFDRFVMEEAAAACKRRESLHGEPFHVDHMIPLAKGGLHAWHNIQVIPARLNLSKKDKLILTTPFEWVAHVRQVAAVIRRDENQ